MTKAALDRRSLLTGVGAASLAAGAGATPAAAGMNPASTPVAAAAAAPSSPAQNAPEPPLVLNATEMAFVVAAVDQLIPGDALSPSGGDCGVATFIDRQLAGAWGSGARLYRSGPYLKGKPEHGYQLPLTPREYFVAGIAAANAYAQAAHGGTLDRLASADQIAVLKALETGEAAFADFSSKGFFDALLLITQEGFFADPIYGGNRDKAGWKMVGYPGLPATYAQAIGAYRGRRYDASPQSIEDFS